MADSDEQKACGRSRHTAWWGQVVYVVVVAACLLQFSAIAIAAHLTEKAADDLAATRYDKWALLVQCISALFAVIALLAYRFLEKRFAVTLWEGGLALVVLGLWAAGIPAMMNPDNGIAVDERGGILNPNLYFSVWVCLAIAVWIFGSYVTEKRLHSDVFAVDASTPVGKWYILCAASVVMVASSSRLFISGNCQGNSEDYCMRTKFAISTGATGTFFALVASAQGSRGKLDTYSEAGMAFILFAMYTTAIAIVTFGGQDAPANFIGNLYFSTWIGFSLSALLVSKSFQSARRLMKGEGGEAEAEAAEPKEEQQEQEADKKDEEVGAKDEEADKKDEEAQQAPPEGPLEVSADEEHEQMDA